MKRDKTWFAIIVIQEKQEKDQAYGTRRVADRRPELPMPYDTWND